MSRAGREIKEAAADPLKNPSFKEAGILAMLRELIGGSQKIFDVLQVEVTSVCPASCTYCPHTTRSGVWKKRHMSADTFAALWPLMKTIRIRRAGQRKN